MQNTKKDELALLAQRLQRPVMSMNEYLALSAEEISMLKQMIEKALIHEEEKVKDSFRHSAWFFRIFPILLATKRSS